MDYQRQSNHCLRDDPLYMYGYSIGTASVYFAVRVEASSCPSSASSSSSSSAECTTTSVILTPDEPTQTSSSGTLYASLEGDLELFDPAPSLTSKYLAVPAGSSASSCNGVNDPQRPDVDLNARCASRITAGENFWMILDSDLFFASQQQCSSFGVTDAAFRAQTDACGAAPGSCTGNQLADYFDADFAKYQADEVGDYFVMFQSASYGFTEMTVDEDHGVSMMQQGIAGTLVFTTSRYQRTSLHVEFDADDFTLSSTVAAGTITAYEVAEFPANALSTTASITYRNDESATLEQKAQFTVVVKSCTAGISSSGAEVSSVLSGATQVDVFTLKRTSAVADSTAADHSCVAVLYDSSGTESDRMTLEFATTAVSQGATTTADAGGLGSGTTTGVFVNPYDPDDICTCGFADVVCYTTSLADCSTTVIVLSSALGAAVLLCFCVSFCLCRCCCGGGGKRRGCCTALSWIFCCPCLCLAKVLPKACKKCIDDEAIAEAQSSGSGSDDDGDDEHHNHGKHHQKRRRVKKNAIVPAQSIRAKPPPEWSEEVDEKTGSTYYFNHRTGATSWQRPPVNADDIAMPRPPKWSAERMQERRAHGDGDGGVDGGEADARQSCNCTMKEQALAACMEYPIASNTGTGSANNEGADDDSDDASAKARAKANDNDAGAWKAYVELHKVRGIVPVGPQSPSVPARAHTHFVCACLRQSLFLPLWLTACHCLLVAALSFDVRPTANQ